MAKGELPQKEITEAAAQREIQRLKEVRDRMGDEAFAVSVGRSVLAHVRLIDSPKLDDFGVQTLKDLESLVTEIEGKPNLASKFITGLRKELTSMRLMGPEK